MKISDLEFYLIQIDRTDGDPPIRSLLVRITVDSGETGWGEGPLPWRSDELLPRRNALLSVLHGRSIFDIEELVRLDSIDTRPLRAILEMASWDVIGRITGQPLCHLMGGCYRPRIPLAVRLPQRGAADIDQLAREMAEHGFHSQIITATGDAEQDANLVATVAEASMGRSEIRLDGMGQFTPETTRQLCELLPDESVRYFLDPIAGNDVTAITQLAAQTSVPLALSTSVTHPKEVMALARGKGVKFIAVNPMCTGGLVAARRCAVVAYAAGITASLTTPVSIGIAAAAMVQLAAANPCFTSGNECGYYQLHNDILVEPLDIIDGMIQVPQSPGLGIEVDSQKLEAYQVG